MAMSPREVALAWFEQVWNQGSEEAIDRFMSPQAPFHGLPTVDGKPLLGPAEFKPMFKTFRAAFPDIHVDVVRSVTEGDLIAVHCHVTGTHRGRDLGNAPTGKLMDIWGMAMGRVKDGKLVEGWNAFDFMTLYQQVDLLPTVAAAALPASK